MSEELKAKIDSLKKKELLTDKGKLKTPEDSEIKKRLKKLKENDLKTLPRGLTIDTTTGEGANIIKIKKASGGRVMYGSGSKPKGCKLAKRGKGKAYGKNS
jgi:hypothetical protein